MTFPKFSLSVSKEVRYIFILGNQSPIDVIYPNKKKIQPCGEYVAERDCNTSRRNINANKPVKIRFVPKEYNQPGAFISDNGFIFGSNGQSYGWSKDISNRMRSYSVNTKPELTTFAEFPPSPLSKFCSTSEADVLCENVTWSVKTGNGKFFVRLYIGDPNNDSVINLKINDIYVVKNQIIPKGDLKVFEATSEAKNGFLIFSPECVDNCDYAVTKINAVELMPYKEHLDKPEPQSNETKVCGEGLMGGKCNTGPDVLHCIFADPSNQVASNCNGSNMLMEIKVGYKCKDLIGNFKCVKKQYDTDEQCKQFCVQSCNKNNCIY